MFSNRRKQTARGETDVSLMPNAKAMCGCAAIRHMRGALQTRCGRGKRVGRRAPFARTRRIAPQGPSVFQRASAPRLDEAALRPFQSALQIHRLEATRPVIDGGTVGLRSFLIRPERAGVGAAIRRHELEPSTPGAVTAFLAVDTRAIPLAAIALHDGRVLVNEDGHECVSR